MSTRIKLLVDAHVFDAEFQGSRTFVEELYKSAMELYAEKIDFHFAAYSNLELKKSFGSDVNFLPLKKKNRLIRIGHEFPGIIKEHDFQWAHFQYIAPPFQHCKYIVTCHDILFESNPEYFPLSYRLTKHLMFKYSAKNADLLTTVSDYSRNEISRQYGISENKIILTKNAVKEIKNETVPLNKKENQILYISRIEPRKNHHTLVEAFLESELPKRNFKLIIVGKESIKNSRFNELIDGLNSDEKKSIQIFDSIGEEEKWDLIDKSRLFVYPSLAEGFGIPPLEAGLRKTMVICSNLTAMKEFSFFKPYHINPENKATLIDSLNTSINDTDQSRLDDISNQIAKDYSWKKSAVTLCESIIGNSL